MNRDNTKISKSESEQRAAVIAGDQAFAAAMRQAIGRGREKVKAATFVDDTPSFARVSRGYAAASCGSPAAMCVE